MFEIRKTLLLLPLAAAMAITGCATQKDAALLNTMEELRREIANMRQMNSNGEAPVATQNAAPKEFTRPSLRATPGLNESSELPVVHLSPKTYSYQGDAPVANALQRPTSQQIRRKNQDIRLPRPEGSDFVYQTLDDYGNAFEGDGQPITIAAPDPALVDEAIEEEVQEPEISILTYDNIDSISTYEPDLGDDPGTASTQALSASPSQPVEPVITEIPDSPPVPDWATTTVGLKAIDPADNDNPKLLYQWGIDALKTKQYEDAVVAFQAILDRHKRHDLADNALYWLGEVHYDQNQYSLALTTFQSVLKRYPLGNKVPDAMVKVGLCFKSLGKDRHAKEILQQVITIYPASDAATVAQARLTAM